MPLYIDSISTSYQTARPSATTLSTAAADIFTAADVFEPIRVTKFGARWTTATGVAPTTAAKWVIKTVDTDDSTLANKAFISLATAQAVGTIVYADLEADGRDFIVTPGQRIRISVDTAAVMPGGSAAGAAIPVYAWERQTTQPMEVTYSTVTKVTSTAT